MATPVRKPHVSTSDLLTWPETPSSDSSHRPSVPAPRSHQPSEGMGKALFGGRVTDEESQFLNKKKPCSGYKLKETTGSGIIAANDENNASESDATNCNDRTSGMFIRVQSMPIQSLLLSFWWLNFQQATNRISQISFSVEETVPLKKLISTPEVAKPVLRSHSESDYEQLQEIGRKIVERCKGLPLAAKTIGSLLRFKKNREEWQIILNSELWQLEEFEKGVVAPLLLSYNDLPSKIKQCFSYCAVFPKDYHLEKDELVKLWIAQGYIDPKENRDMEMIGQEYFNCLAARSFFQEFQNDEEGTIIRCKMHDIVHDFAKLLTKKECSFVQIDGAQESISTFDHEKLRHLMLELDIHASISLSIANTKKLRSLLIYIRWIKVDSCQSLFNQMICLRALTIVGKYSSDSYQMIINALLNGIRKLIHLRYLHLYGMDIEELLETCCELFNLQTLDIRGCATCERLPQGIGKLVNLRHLIFGNNHLAYMPKGIERLTSLRTLSEFVVVRRDGQYGSEACNFDGLKELNYLRGSLEIRGLENVTDVDEVKNAHLEKKENLVRLQLKFSDYYRYSERRTERMDHEEIIEALRPPPNLESLDIKVYEGKTLFPNWILSLNKLKHLIIRDCLNLEIMPPLGKLPSLEVLEVWLMRLIKRVGDEFLGIASSSGTSSSITAFPKLKTLTFE